MPPGTFAMADLREDVIASHLQRSLAAMERAAADAGFVGAMRAIADTVTRALRGGNKLLLAGNGGSAADAQHIAAELMVRLKINRAALPAVALTTDTSALTAIGNDFGFEHLFERQVRGLGRHGDVLIAISTSGRSPNILAALTAARELGLTTIGFTGAPKGAAAMGPLCDLVLAAPTEEIAVIQQIYMVAAHAICDAIECALFAHAGS
jgi:D-sedoheptulose 7-phosphate isomerase